MATLFKRGKKWYISYYLYGKQIKRAVSTDRRIAERVLADTIKRLDLQKFRIENPNISWEEFVEKYLSYSKTNKRPKSVQRDIATIKIFTDLMKPIKVASLTPQMFEDYKAKRVESGVKPSSVNRELNTLKNMVRKAYEWGYLPENFSSQIKRLKDSTQAKKVRFFSKEEIEKLLKVSSETVKKIVLIGLNTGFRIGEIVNLTWDDIDFNRKVAIVQAKQDWQPKDNDLREVPLKDNFVKILKEWKQKTKSQYVLGKKFTTEQASSLFRKYARLAGITDASAHTLRHTFASYLAMAGVDLYTIAKLLGHSDVSTTQIYAHLLPDTLRNAVNKLPF